MSGDPACHTTGGGGGVLWWCARPPPTHSTEATGSCKPHQAAPGLGPRAPQMSGRRWGPWGALRGQGRADAVPSRPPGRVRYRPEAFGAHPLWRVWGMGTRRAPFNTRHHGGGGGGAPPGSPRALPLKILGQISSGPLADQNFSLVPSAPIRLDQRFSSALSAPLKTLHHRMGVGGAGPPPPPKSPGDPPAKCLCGSPVPWTKERARDPRPSGVMARLPVLVVRHVLCSGVLGLRCLLCGSLSPPVVLRPLGCPHCPSPGSHTAVPQTDKRSSQTSSLRRRGRQSHTPRADRSPGGLRWSMARSTRLPTAPPARAGSAGRGRGCTQAEAYPMGPGARGGLGAVGCGCGPGFGDWTWLACARFSDVPRSLDGRAGGGLEGGGLACWWPQLTPC